MKKKTCPICKRKVDPAWLVETDIPTVVRGKKCGTIPAVLAECCSTIYLDDRIMKKKDFDLVMP